MAVIDIAEVDLDEMLREEAEDVFSEDGRLAKGHLNSLKADLDLQVGYWRTAGWSDWLFCDLWS